jgi:hypothetical protein
MFLGDVYLEVSPVVRPVVILIRSAHQGAIQNLCNNMVWTIS